MQPDPSGKEFVIDTIEKKKPEMQAFLIRPEWAILEQKPDYTIYYIDEPSGLRSLKSEAVIDKPMKEVFDYIFDLSKKTEIDHALEKASNVIVYDDHYSLQYYKYKGQFLYSPREFYGANYRNYDEDFSEFYCTSYDGPELPEDPKNERAELIYGGYQLKKVGENKTNVLFYNLIKLKINQMMVNSTLKEVAMQVKYLKDLMK